MNKLKTLMLASVMSLFVAAISHAEGFTGIYFGVTGGTAGAELDGKYTDSNGDVTKGRGGVVSEIAGLDAGWNIGMGDSMSIGLGVNWFGGDAQIGKGDDAADTADITITAEEFVNYYLQANFIVSENTAIFAKVGTATADLKYTGSAIGGTKPADMDGETWALGLMSTMGGNMFIKSEVGMTEYDTITVNDITGASGGGSTGDIVADPTLAYGLITIGYTF